MKLHDLLIDCGYRLIDDAWAANGRLTYIHDDDADKSHLSQLKSTLGRVGWQINSDKLRSFFSGDEEIEIEPGGADVSGHFLHHLDVTRISIS